MGKLLPMLMPQRKLLTSLRTLHIEPPPPAAGPQGAHRGCELNEQSEFSRCIESSEAGWKHKMWMPCQQKAGTEEHEREGDRMAMQTGLNAQD